MKPVTDEQLRDLFGRDLGDRHADWLEWLIEASQSRKDTHEQHDRLSK
jgi:hypothetical protein